MSGFYLSAIWFTDIGNVAVVYRRKPGADWEMLFAVEGEPPDTFSAPAESAETAVVASVRAIAGECARRVGVDVTEILVSSDDDEKVREAFLRVPFLELEWLS